MARRRILYFDLLLFLFAAFVLLRGWLFHLLFLFFLLLPIVLLFLVLPLRYAVRVRLAAEEDLAAKGSYVLNMDVENRSILPCACLEIALASENLLGRSVTDADADRVGTIRLATALQPKAHTAWAAETVFDCCGRYDIAVKNAWVSDPLGLIRLPLAVKNRTAERMQLYVLPSTVHRTMDAEKNADLGRDSDVYSTVKPGGDPAELFQLRDYRAGDAQHSIHWKLSGRWDRLIVREFGLPLSPSLCFLVSISHGAAMQAAESVLATVLSVSEYLLAQDTPHRIGWVGEDGALVLRDVDAPHVLADVLHGLLSLPATKQGETLNRYLTMQPPQPELHLLLLTAGAQTQSESYDRLLNMAAEGGFCRRLTLLQDGMNKQRAEQLRNLGCEAYLLDGRRPDAEEVF